MSIASLTQEQARKIVRENSLTGNLNHVFGSNGRSGRAATGNFSLLAKATGLSRVHVGKVFRGKVQPSYPTLIKFSEATGISISKISEFIQDKQSKE